MTIDQNFLHLLPLYVVTCTYLMLHACEAHSGSHVFVLYGCPMSEQLQRKLDIQINI